MESDRTLLDALLALNPGTPKGRAKQWILAGRVSINGVVVRRPHQPVMQTDVVDLGGRHASTLDCGSGLQIHPRVSLLHLDSSVAVVNKGPGLLSVPAIEGELSALSILADFLSGKLKPRDHNLAGKPLPPAYRRLRPLPVHRLDQYTTGLFCMATNPGARENLIEQLKTHTMRREYIAFVEGRPEARKGTWRHWVQLSRDELRQQVISGAASPLPPGEGGVRGAGEDAREAITHYEVITEYPLADGKHCVTKLRLRLETGRKHQIRVQAAFAGLPLVGDRTYNPHLRAAEPSSSSVIFPRQALHATLLSLDHPDSPGKKMTWTADLPKDLRQLEAALRAGAHQARKK